MARIISMWVRCSRCDGRAEVDPSKACQPTRLPPGWSPIPGGHLCPHCSDEEPERGPAIDNTGCDV
jgi:hypothetical protein